MNILEIILIALFCVIQSIFGVGLLLLGTPTFLLIGYDFFEVLNILLPYSIVISFLQIFVTKDRNFEFGKKILIHSVPFLILGLFHGLTNLGGSLLTIISSNVHSDKNIIRYNISSGYFIFALFQLLLINVFFKQINFDYLKFIWLPVIIFTLSQTFFKKMNDTIYYTSLNIFTLFYGIYIFADIIYSYF